MPDSQEMNFSQPPKSSINPLLIAGLVGVVLLIVAGVIMSQTSQKNAPATNNQMEAKQTLDPEDNSMMETSESVNELDAPANTATDSMMNVDSSSGTVDAEGVRTFNIEAGAFYYNPKQMNVKVGEKVKIVMTSKDMMHDLNIDELNVKSGIAKAGETVTVEFTADKAGSYEYYCAVGQHRANGQVGTLIVE